MGMRITTSRLDKGVFWDVVWAVVWFCSSLAARYIYIFWGYGMGR